MNNQDTVGASREEAITKGLVRFQASKPCVRGHMGHRYTLTGNCVQCVIDRSLAHQAKMRDRIRAARAQAELRRQE